MKTESSSFFIGSKRMNQGRHKAPLIVISNRFEGKAALKLYHKRWGIERLFGHLKKQGFDLEATHMTASCKLEKLFALVVLAFVYSYAWGCHLRASGVKSNAASNWKSLFRLGLEDIVRRLQFTYHKADAPEDLKGFYDWIQRLLFSSIFLV